MEFAFELLELTGTPPIPIGLLEAKNLVVTLRRASRIELKEIDLTLK